ncbi:MAG: hypothetical protein M3393_02935 [Actinomycetota bacterium]|nr:hypothetical protein [Actinomycetota bacterium]
MGTSWHDLATWRPGDLASWRPGDLAPDAVMDVDLVSAQPAARAAALRSDPG